ncbi:MAG: UvrABC system protein B [Candidatus Moranbacteria bacterium GW2011_GWC2_37_73]|nr:MAG: UvrABC system protein B [Parcubacteria group bacterium GW2011_GWC1_36_108]KKQ40106.1 MAG: UvrABC system protein B [Candidatus Moranbacteria bacterium GW2011_GWC2_37_73]HAR99575.1 excinuclease ABC subunit B [Candidatus Moranbacteria bacterium]HBI50283.1 excinuclease ABC subunit B [Candidatus Moranbacteria bacterium]HBU10986.1 excinuclease ABC subunit B [Candidatus Moranbacteria bacterium]
MKFELDKKFTPAGDQPSAIEALIYGLEHREKFQTLMGVTGSGKTFTMANVIEHVQKPTLVIAPNKTLAAQLVQEFRTFFPKNAVEYFVSYYDYYQPEAYISSSDTYIEKEVQINEEIDRLRHAATSGLLSRRDVIIVASVSCIYGLGSPDYYREGTAEVIVGAKQNREELMKGMIDMQYHRSDVLARGKFRVTGDTIEVMTPSREIVTRIELKEGKVARIYEYDFLTGEKLGELEKTLIYPAKHFVVPEPVMKEALGEIEREAKERVKYFRDNNKLLEAERIERRTKQDLEMMREVGYCNGIENYSRYLTEREAGEPPYTLVDYFPKDFLMIIDESHVTIPQLNAMYAGDRSRKNALIENGFRLPSAYDNRPLKFPEFEERINQMIFTTATPAAYEKEHSSSVAQQIIRPTGLLDPEIIIKSAKGQVKDVLAEIEKVVAKKERVLITALTKKMAEDLSEFLKEHGVRCEYLHSDVDTLDRVLILQGLRKGDFDVLVGVNLLREGLDLPEVSSVAILDADKEGFLRSETSLIQTIGRAARNINGRVILYADNITGSMKRAIDETNRRRKIQAEYNKKHHITPKTIEKNIKSIVDHEINPEIPLDFSRLESLEDIAGYIKQKEKEMKNAARSMEFEKAALIRDEISTLRKLQLK